MKQRVPKKNISGDISDIKKSVGSADLRRDLASDSSISEKASSDFFKNSAQNHTRGPLSPVIPEKHGAPLKKLVLIPIFLVLALLLLWGAGVYAKWNNLVKYFNSTDSQISGFLGNPGEKAAGQNGSSSSEFTLLDLMKNKSLWGNAGSVYSGFHDFSAAGMGLLQEADTLDKNWPTFVFKGGGRELIAHLTKAKEYLSSMSEADSRLNSFNLGLGDFLMSEYGSPLSFRMSFQRLDTFMGALIKWLSSENDRHVLILFENSSEMRPGGGFIGSYADAVFSGGSLKSFEAHDINDADRKFAANIIPPRQLQGIEKGWTIADSNWFFDYPLSASKTTGFMEQSGLYSGKVSFDGVVAISPKVVGDVLDITGPVELAGRNLTITKDNFITEVQKEVQNAQASGVSPKKIISEIAPVILSRLALFDPGKNNNLAKKINGWITGKDLTIYFKDSDIESFIDFYKASGRMFQPSSDFNGDYLAVSSANIGSGKSDIFIKQKVFFRTQINLDGMAGNHIEISRHNTAGSKDPWWYRSPNESYVQIFAPSDASLSGFTGGLNKKIVPKTDYGIGYSPDPLVYEIESTLAKNFNYPSVDEFRESGKKVFGTWVKTAPGQTSSITADYSIHLFSAPSGGQKYQFVMDKQTGSSGNYSFEIYAPVGFYWEESNLPVFEYDTSEPQGRTVLNLTLQKQKD